jgi:hypothetical protein
LQGHFAYLASLFAGAAMEAHFDSRLARAAESLTLGGLFRDQARLCGARIALEETEHGG